MELVVTEIFHSLQGESTRAGFPSVFVRLTGCNLRCSYCDTGYARLKGEPLTFDAIFDLLSSFAPFDHITITGGEPLFQINTLPFLEILLNNGHHVRLETNGSWTLSEVPGGVRKIVDIKTPSSGMEESFLMDNLSYLNKKDEIKFVIADEKDYIYSVEFIKKHLAKIDSVINLSPVYGMCPPNELAARILSDRLPVRLNLQLHKIIWPDGEPKTYKEE